MRRLAPYNLWLGHAGDARNYRRLFDEGIRAIVLLAIEEPLETAPRDFIIARIPLIDGTGNDLASVHLAISTVAMLITSRTETLVTCSAGLSRTPSIVAAAIAIAEGRDPNDCLKQVIGKSAADVSPALWNQVTQVLQERRKSGSKEGLTHHNF